RRKVAQDFLDGLLSCKGSDQMRRNLGIPDQRLILALAAIDPASNLLEPRHAGFEIAVDTRQVEVQLTPSDHVGVGRQLSQRLIEAPSAGRGEVLVEFVGQSQKT